VSAKEPAFVAWLAERGLPLYAWSSQAAGFFSGLQPDGYLAQAWFSDDNLERRRRAEQLATDRGVEPVAVALAWVLHQPLPIFPIIGPRRTAELATSLAALDVELSDDEAAWLDLSER
jgi:aryl-alcohol dehydrogenase-like predicted oxidoreductase